MIVLMVEAIVAVEPKSIDAVKLVYFGSLKDGRVSN